MGSEGFDKLSLDSIRQTLIALEDTIIFSLIARAKFPLNSPAYDPNANKNASFPGSLMEFLVKGAEAVQSQGGRYQTPEEVPFFPGDLPSAIICSSNCSQILPPAAASISVNKNIWDIYVNQFLPLLAAKGDDGNYALAVASDLACLQAISRRIHYGKYVAEVKFRGAPEAYTAAIRAKDRDALMNMLTDEKVEAMVKQRVQKKAMVFGQEVTLTVTSNNSSNCKVDPSLVYRLYDEWIIPLTKEVEVEYLLRRLD